MVSGCMLVPQPLGPPLRAESELEKGAYRHHLLGGRPTPQGLGGSRHYQLSLTARSQARNPGEITVTATMSVTQVEPSDPNSTVPPLEGPSRP